MEMIYKDNFFVNSDIDIYYTFIKQTYILNKHQHVLVNTENVCEMRKINE